MRLKTLNLRTSEKQYTKMIFVETKHLLECLVKNGKAVIN
jgi:hypothetical protein